MASRPSTRRLRQRRPRPPPRRDPTDRLEPAGHGTMATMTDQAVRYDRIAEGYARWWAPVIAPSALLALDEVAPAIAAGAPRDPALRAGNGNPAAARVARVSP